MEASIGRSMCGGRHVEVACGVVRMEGWRMEAMRVSESKNVWAMGRVFNFCFYS